MRVVSIVVATAVIVVLLAFALRSEWRRWRQGADRRTSERLSGLAVAVAVALLIPVFPVIVISGVQGGPEAHQRTATLAGLFMAAALVGFLGVAAAARATRSLEVRRARRDRLQLGLSRRRRMLPIGAVKVLWTLITVALFFTAALTLVTSLSIVPQPGEPPTAAPTPTGRDFLFVALILLVPAIGVALGTLHVRRQRRKHQAEDERLLEADRLKLGL